MKDNTIILIGAGVLALALLGKTGTAAPLGSNIGEGAGGAVGGFTGGLFSGFFRATMDEGGDIYDMTLKPYILNIKSWGNPYSFWS